MAGAGFISAGVRAANAGAVTITPGLPISVTRGILLAEVALASNATISTATAGWSLVGQTNSGAGFTSALFIASYGVASPVFTWTGSAACSAIVVAYDDPSNPLNAASVGASTVSFGSASPATTASITTTANNSAVIYIAASAVFTATTNPSGFSTDTSSGSATDGGWTFFGNKQIAALGGASGATSVVIGGAPWVARQVELVLAAPGNGLQACQAETGAWVMPPAGLTSSQAETGAWFMPPPGLAASQLEVGAWLIPATVVPIGRRRSWMRVFE